MSGKVFIIGSEGIGRGDDRLGLMLAANFLRLLGENKDKPATMIFMNSGVKLVCENSPVLEHVQRLEQQGVEILACTTCLEYFDVKEKQKVGKPTTMVRTIQSMMSSETVCL